PGDGVAHRRLADARQALKPQIESDTAVGCGPAAKNSIQINRDLLYPSPFIMWMCELYSNPASMKRHTVIVIE
ncbi:MAG: hypothetical protein AB2535_18775, partial [Candidatus Thiodiazotropha endolucinida]